MGLKDQSESSRELWIVAIAAAGIASHLGLRFFAAPVRLADAPLYAVLVLGGLPSFWIILRKLFQGDVGSDVLAGISLVCSVAMGQLLVAAILALMLSGGGALERFASRRASRILQALARRVPQVAHRKRDITMEDVPLDRVAVGDVLVVLPHEICPVDGVVIEGHGSMNEAYLTGEPYEMPKVPGSSVISGAINGDYALTLRAQKLAVDSRYARIMKVMEETDRNRPRLRRLGDQLAVAYIPLTLALAAAAWLSSGNASRFLAVLVVATPCPLLIAIPVAVIGAVSLAARQGIIIKDPTVLERIAQCRTAIFDKTGTLTYGKPSLTEILCAPGVDRDEILRLAAGLERYSKHPLASAILQAAEERKLVPAEAAEAGEKPGQGLSGIVKGRKVSMTGRRWAESEGMSLPPKTQGLECIAVLDGAFAALFRFRDVSRVESRPFLAHLPLHHGMTKLMLISGDRESEVRYLAEAVGIRDVAGEKSPEEKVEIVARETGRTKTLFVGDGINDAPALLAATVGVALGTNSDITSEAAGAVVLSSDLGKIDELLHIGYRMRTIALESALGGMALSLFGMFLAAAGHLSPLEGAVMQELIDLAAVLNAVRVSLPPTTLTDF